MLDEVYVEMNKWISDPWLMGFVVNIFQMKVLLLQKKEEGIPRVIYIANFLWKP